MREKKRKEGRNKKKKNVEWSESKLSREIWGCSRWRVQILVGCIYLYICLSGCSMYIYIFILYWGYNMYIYVMEWWLLYWGQNKMKGPQVKKYRVLCVIISPVPPGARERESEKKCVHAGEKEKKKRAWWQQTTKARGLPFSFFFPRQKFLMVNEAPFFHPQFNLYPPHTNSIVLSTK